MTASHSISTGNGKEIRAQENKQEAVISSPSIFDTFIQNHECVVMQNLPLDPVVLPCGNTMSLYALVLHMKSKIFENQMPTCPCCRKELPLKEIPFLPQKKLGESDEDFGERSFQFCKSFQLPNETDQDLIRRSLGFRFIRHPAHQQRQDQFLAQLEYLSWLGRYLQPNVALRNTVMTLFRQKQILLDTFTVDVNQAYFYSDQPAMMEWVMEIVVKQWLAEISVEHNTNVIGCVADLDLHSDSDIRSVQVKPAIAKIAKLLLDAMKTESAKNPLLLERIIKLIVSRDMINVFFEPIFGHFFPKAFQADSLSDVQKLLFSAVMQADNRGEPIFIAVKMTDKNRAVMMNLWKATHLVPEFRGKWSYAFTFFDARQSSLTRLLAFNEDTTNIVLEAYKEGAVTVKSICLPLKDPASYNHNVVPLLYLARHKLLQESFITDVFDPIFPAGEELKALNETQNCFFGALLLLDKFTNCVLRSLVLTEKGSEAVVRLWKATHAIPDLKSQWMQVFNATNSRDTIFSFDLTRAQHTRDMLFEAYQDGFIALETLCFVVNNHHDESINKKSVLWCLSENENYHQTLVDQTITPTFFSQREPLKELSSSQEKLLIALLTRSMDTKKSAADHLNQSELGNAALVKLYESTQYLPKAAALWEAHGKPSAKLKRKINTDSPSKFFSSSLAKLPSPRNSKPVQSPSSVSKRPRMAGHHSL